MTAPTPRRQVLLGGRFFRWEDSGPLQNLGHFDWVVLVPGHYSERPDFVPTHAESRRLNDGEVAFFWTRGLGL